MARLVLLAASVLLLNHSVGAYSPLPGDTAVWPKKGLIKDSFGAKPVPGPENTGVVVTPYASVTESNMKYRKRVWRQIDSRQKLNSYFTWQGDPLNKVLYQMAIKGQATAYQYDSLKSTFDLKTLATLGDKKVKTLIHNWRSPNDPTDLVDTFYQEKFDWKSIIKYEVMEDWYFDAAQGAFVSRIIAIAPLYQVTVNGLNKDMPMFWLKMTDLRAEFAKHKVTTRNSQPTMLTWDDVFNSYHLYDGFIVKATGSDGKYLSSKPEYMHNGVDMLLASEELKHDLFIFEHDLWEY